MRVLLVAGLGIALAAIWFAPTSGQNPSAGKDDADILGVLTKLTQAYGERDAKKFAALWSEKAEYFDEDEQERLQGRKAIEDDFAATFAKQPQARLEIDVDKVRRVSPDVAAVEGSARVLRPKELPRRSRFVALLVRQQGVWLIDSVRESTLPDADSNVEFLEDLAWLNGTWTY